MTVLSTVASAATVIGVSVPTVLFSATDDTSVQLQNAVKEAAAMIAEDAGHDWSALQATATITGDGVATAFNFPSNYKRMLKKARLWPSSSPYAPYRHYADTDTWLGITVQNFTPIVGAWTILGTQINVLPLLGAGQTVQYRYMTNTPVLDASSAAQITFQADTDTFPIGERLLRLAFVYRWKQDRGQDYGEAMSDYDDSLASHIGKDKGSNIITIGQQRVPQGGDTGIAFPYNVGT